MAIPIPRLPVALLISEKVLIEERIVEHRSAYLIGWRAEAFLRRGRPGDRFAPHFTVAQNFLDYLRFFDKSHDLHSAPAFGAFERVNLIHGIYQRSPGDPAFPAKRHIRFLLHGPTDTQTTQKRLLIA
jgi:hypothetical protein